MYLFIPHPPKIKVSNWMPGRLELTLSYPTTPEGAQTLWNNTIVW